VSDAFEEVEEDLRRERYSNFFKKYGLWLLGGLVLILAAVGGYEWYQSHSLKNAGVYADKLSEGQKLLESREFAAADTFLSDVAKSAPPAYKSAALTLAATAKLEQNDLQGALTKLDAAADAARDPLLKDAARLKAAYVAADLQDFKAIEPRLEKMIKDAGPFSFQARELLGAEAFEAGELAKAREQFTFLASALDSPEGVRQRARGALAVIGPEDKAAPAPTGAPK
jgi:hypothetical protein